MLVWAEYTATFQAPRRGIFTDSSCVRHLPMIDVSYEKRARATKKGGSMKTFVFGLVFTLALAVGIPVAQAQNNQGNQNTQDGVPRLDHVFVIVLENHNSFTSFGSIGILDNPQAPNNTALWHPSLPNYIAMITGDWIGTDVLGTGHTYPAGSTVGISDDDSPSV